MVFQRRNWFLSIDSAVYPSTVSLKFDYFLYLIFLFLIQTANLPCLFIKLILIFFSSAILLFMPLMKFIIWYFIFRLK